MKKLVTQPKLMFKMYDFKDVNPLLIVSDSMIMYYFVML